MATKRTLKRGKAKIVKRVKPWWADIPTLSTPPEIQHTDERGSFQVIATPKSFGHAIGSISVIHSKAGSVRAEHRHKMEAHLCHLVSGKMLYWERDVDRGSKLDFSFSITPGMNFFTPPGPAHAFEFLEDSVVICISDGYRSQEAYEKDLVRLAPEERIVKRP